MKKRIAFWVWAVSVLLFFGFSSTGYAWGPSAHIQMTREALISLAGEEVAQNIATFSDDPDFWSPRDQPPYDYGHRIKKYMLTEGEGEGTERPGAEEGAAYWAQRAREAYQKYPNTEEWQLELGYACHFLADAMCPPHCTEWNRYDQAQNSHTIFEAKYIIISDRLVSSLQNAKLMSFSDSIDIKNWIVDQAKRVRAMGPPEEEKHYYSLLTFYGDNEIKEIMTNIGAGIKGLYAFVVSEEILHWESRTPMPTPRSWAGTVVYDRKIYVVGGCSCSSACQQFYNAVGTLEVYNPLNDTWISLNPAPIPVVGPAVAAVDGKIYVFGGFNRAMWSANPNVQIYNITTGAWTKGANMPTQRSWAKAEVLDGKIYVIGGVGYGYRRDVETYNPLNNTWELKSPILPRERYLHAAVAYNGKIYVIGGDSWQHEYNEVWDDIQEYDPATNTWTKKSHMPAPATGIDAVVVNGKIIYLVD